MKVRRTLRAYNNTTKPRVDEPETPAWIQKALNGNGAFLSTERPVASAPPLTPLQRSCSDHNGRTTQTPWLAEVNNAFSTSQSTFGLVNNASAASFSKHGLEKAKVLGQVDSKFIACLMDIGEEANSCSAQFSLVLIDQHAADERIRVERFLKPLCLEYQDRFHGSGVARRILHVPLPVLLTKYEHERLLGDESMQKAFADWGFEVHEEEMLGPKADEAYATACFRTVPEALANKVNTPPFF